MRKTYILLPFFTLLFGIFSSPLAAKEASKQEHFQNHQDCLSCKCRVNNKPGKLHPDSINACECDLRGVWLPEDPPLFRPLAADPRQPTYSLGKRFNDNVMPKNTIPVSYWNTFPLYRFVNLWGGMMQFELEGCLWAIFDPDTYSAPLINADYYVSFTTTYAICKWSYRFRYFHISSHIGDEYLLNHPQFWRRNPSTETLDLFASYDLSDELRFYGGLGWVLNEDRSFRETRFLAEGGAELRIPRLGFNYCKSFICGRPFFAFHLRYKADFRKHIDATYALGYEFGKCSGSCKRWRAFVEYHDGYSVEGQFRKEPTTYLSVRISYGY